MSLHRLVPTALVLLLSLAVVGPVVALELDEADAGWTTLLARHVSWNAAGTNTAVDYAGFARDREALQAYLDALASVDETRFQAWPKPRRMAFLINAYNAYTIELVLTRYPELDSIRDLGNLLRSPWKRRFAPLLGKTRTLDDIEHVLLRGAEDFDEPRIHFAVNCASVGCPALRPEAYVAQQLDAQLDDQTHRFLADRSRNRLDGEDRMAVSSIFKWYGGDFGDVGGVQPFLAIHADVLGVSPSQRRALEHGALRLRYLDYDWALNSPANIR